MNAVFQEVPEVPNQSPPLEGYDAYSDDPWLVAAIERAGVGWIADQARALGTYVGSAEAQHHAMLANRYTPELQTHDRVSGWREPQLCRAIREKHARLMKTSSRCGRMRTLMFQS